MEQTQSATIARNTSVIYTTKDGEELEAMVLDYKAGWYTLELEDGETLKARAAAVALPADEEEQNEGEEAEDDETDENSVAAKMAAALRKARVNYRKVRTMTGGASADCGDAVAEELHWYETPADVASLADRVLQTADGFHLARYGHLNNGQVRMNSGNRIRSAYNKARDAAAADTATLADIGEYKRIAELLGLWNDPEDADDAEQEAAAE